MHPIEAYEKLLTRFRELSDLSSASGVLGWDQETMMPPGGAGARAHQLATLARIHHERLTAPEVGDWLGDAEPGTDRSEVERAQLREMRYDFDQATRLPIELVQELAAAQSQALHVWAEARPNNDFASFAPHLQKLLDLCRRKAEAIGFEGELYDALLNEYERGATAASVRALFADLREQLAPLAAAVMEHKDRVDASCVLRNLDENAQGAFGLHVIRQMGFDLRSGRVDLSAHPFCSGIGQGDVRLTRRYLDGDLRGGLFGIVHEAGHGLYEQGLPQDLGRTPAGQAVSLGVHESQSRLWENLIGRSLPFWEYFLPALREHLPGQFDDLSAVDMFKAVNQVQASLVRVEADELTYNLHIILRFEIEQALLSGQLAVNDLPGAWNEASKQLLGVTAPDDRDGCMQDIHWSMGAFGYFPTYTLGNVYSAQFLDAARIALPDLDDQVRHGDFAPLLAWLRTHVHEKGKLYSPTELVEQATGAPPSPEPFLDYLRAKLAVVYEL